MEPVEVETVRFEVDAGVTLEGDRSPPPTPWAEPSSVTPTRSTAALDEIWSSTRPPERSSTPAGTCSASTSRGRFDRQPRWRDTEQLDVRAAIDVVADDRPVIVAGYSFGADVALSVTDPRISRWITVAPVLSIFTEFAAAHDARPKTLIAAAHDQFRPAAAQLGGRRLEEHRRRRGGGSRSLLPRCPAGDRRRIGAVLP